MKEQNPPGCFRNTAQGIRVMPFRHAAGIPAFSYSDRKRKMAFSGYSNFLTALRKSSAAARFQKHVSSP